MLHLDNLPRVFLQCKGWWPLGSQNMLFVYMIIFLLFFPPFSTPPPPQPPSPRPPPPPSPQLMQFCDLCYVDAQTSELVKQLRRCVKVEVNAPGLPVPNSPDGLCGRKATMNLTCTF